MANGYAKYSGLVSSGGGVASLNGLTGALSLTSTGSTVTITPGTSTIDLEVPAGAGLTLAAFGSTPNANGLSLSAGVLNMQPADVTHPGGVSILAQTFAGTKTFNNQILLSNGTNSAPAWSFANQTNSGSYYLSSTTWGISVLGANVEQYALSSPGSFGNVGMGGPASSSDAYPVLIQRSLSSAINFQISNSISATAGAGAKIQAVSDAGNNTMEMSTFPSATATPDIYAGGGGVLRFTTSGGTATDMVLVTDAATNSSIRFYAGGDAVNNKIMALNSAGLTMYNSLPLITSGVSSGAVSIQSISGTYNFNLPATAGTSGYFLTSAGGGSNAMTWTNPTSITPTFSGLTQYAPAYATSTTALGTIASTGTSGNPLVSGGASAAPVYSATPTLAGVINTSNVLNIKDSSDNTKILAVNISGMTTAKTLTLTSAQSTSQSLAIPNITGSDTLATLGLAQTFSAIQTFTLAPVFSSVTASQLLSVNSSKALTSIAYATTPTASTIAEWDANINFAANNFQNGWATTATAAGTTTLTVSSAGQQAFTGSTTQTVVLPAVSTLVLGTDYTIFNLSSGVVTVQSSGANTIQAMAANTVLTVTSIATTGTSTSAWEWTYQNLNSSLPMLNPMTTGGDTIYGGTSGAPTRLANGSSGQVLTSSGGTAAPVWSSVGVPSGTIVMYGASTAPTGWLNCDGSAVSRTTYSALFAIVSTTFGSGDGSTTFNLPDTRGIFIRGSGTSGKLTNANSTAFSGTLGTYQNDKMQGHKHSQIIGGSGYVANSQFGLSTDGGAGSWTATGANAVGSPTTDGTNGTPRTGAETNPANLGLNFIIKT